MDGFPVLFARRHLVLKVKRTQILQLLLRQALCGLGGGVGGLFFEEVLHVCKHTLQQVLDLVHHLPDDAPGFGVHPCLGRLLEHKVPETLRRAEHRLHGIGGDLLESLVVSQLLPGLGVLVEVALDELLGALCAALLHKIVQQPVHHGLPRLGAPLVQRVERLVHHRFTARISGKEHLARSGLDTALGVVLQPLHHPVDGRAGALGRQLQKGLVCALVPAHGLVAPVYRPGVRSHRALSAAQLPGLVGVVHFGLPLAL